MIWRQTCLLTEPLLPLYCHTDSIVIAQAWNYALVTLMDRVLPVLVYFYKVLQRVGHLNGLPSCPLLTNLSKLPSWRVIKSASWDLCLGIDPLTQPTTATILKQCHKELWADQSILVCMWADRPIHVGNRPRVGREVTLPPIVSELSMGQSNFHTPLQYWV